MAIVGRTGKKRTEGGKAEINVTQKQNRMVAELHVIGFGPTAINAIRSVVELTTQVIDRELKSQINFKRRKAGKKS